MKLCTKHFLVVIFTFFSSPEAVISRFEQRDRAVDSRAVAEYIRALVATDAIDEYLPDEQSGKPSSLPTLVINHASFFFLSKYFSFGHITCTSRQNNKL